MDGVRILKGGLWGMATIRTDCVPTVGTGQGLSVAGIEGIRDGCGLGVVPSQKKSHTQDPRDERRTYRLIV